MLTDVTGLDGGTFKDDETTCVLFIDDEKPWNDADDRHTLVLQGEETMLMHDFVHIVYLFDKFYNYVCVIETNGLVNQRGQIPDRYEIHLLSDYALNDRGKWFLDLVRSSLDLRNIGYDFEQPLDNDLLLIRAELMMARHLREERLATSVDTGVWFPPGREAHELGDTVWIEDFPSNIVPHIERLGVSGPDMTLPDYSQNIAQVAGMIRTPDTIEMIILDAVEWRGDDDCDMDLLANKIDLDMMARHDFCHALIFWRRAAWILEQWIHRQVPSLTEDDYHRKLNLGVATTFPLNDRGRWFADWLKRCMELCGCGFSIELDERKVAKERRNAASVRS